MLLIRIKSSFPEILLFPFLTYKRNQYLSYNPKVKCKKDHNKHISSTRTIKPYSSKETPKFTPNTFKKINKVKQLKAKFSITLYKFSIETSQF